MNTSLPKIAEELEAGSRTPDLWPKQEKFQWCTLASPSIKHELVVDRSALLLLASTTTASRVGWLSVA
jgi:hypothetical protein